MTRRMLEWAMVTLMGSAFAYFVATTTSKFIEQSFAEAAKNIEQMGHRQ